MLLLVSIALMTGCGGAKNSGRPETIPVSGTVTYQGKAVENATVTFRASSGGRGAVAKTDQAGNFKMTTVEPGDGVVAGNYRVTIDKVILEGHAASDSSGGAPAPAGAPKNLLPAKYASPSDSGLTAEVKKGGDNKFTFELTD